MKKPDRKYMQEAIRLANLGKGWVSPNPPVGCVIVSNGMIVGRGYHQRYGEAHAEVNALLDAGMKARGADAYVTLMPCNHFGKTPPCTKALVEAGIKRVFVAVDDPDSTSGDGLIFLRESGLEVEVGLLSVEAERVMHGFCKYIRQGLPHITLKYAMTLDGKIATSSGSSKWISSPDSRAVVQRLRSESDAVMVGSNTLLQDDPQLNVRDQTCAQPFRVIIDSKLRTPPDARVFSSAGSKVIILTADDADESKINDLCRTGAEVVTVSKTAAGYIDLKSGLMLLSEQFGIRDIFCEGGGGLAGALLRERLIDRVISFIAPKILGGSGISPAEGGNIPEMNEAVMLSDFECSMIGNDILCSGWFTDK